MGVGPGLTEQGNGTKRWELLASQRRERRWALGREGVVAMTIVAGGKAPRKEAPAQRAEVPRLTSRKVIIALEIGYVPSAC